MTIQTLPDIDHSLLPFLRQNTLLGHGVLTADGEFAWQRSAALIDCALHARRLGDAQAVGVEVLRRQLEEDRPGDRPWQVSLQVAEPAPLPRGFAVDTVGATQLAFLAAMDALPRIARSRNDRLLMALSEYGLGNDEPSETLRQILYDDTDVERRRPRMFRLDTVGGTDVHGRVAISEAQLAMAGLAVASRIPFRQGLIGYDRLAAQAFLQVMRQLTGQAHPTIALVVEAGVAQYWQETNDLRLVLSDIDPDCRVYAVGNGGFAFETNDDGSRSLFYTNTLLERRERIDAVYTVADARRLLAPDMLPLLHAARDKAVVVQPTLNPLLNNYHLLRALIFHCDLTIQSRLAEALAAVGVPEPAALLSAVRSQTIPMSLVDAENVLDLEALGIKGHHSASVTWDEVIAGLRGGGTSRTGDGASGLLTKQHIKGLLVRTILAPDLSLLSGGRGSRRMYDFPNPRKATLAEALAASVEGMAELRATGATDKPILGVEPLVRHHLRQSDIHSLRDDGSVVVQSISARQRFCPLYMLTGATREGAGPETPLLVSAFSFYSSVESTYKLGGAIYAVGPHLDATANSDTTVNPASVL